MRLFYDVDTAHDFMDADGRLYVPGAEAIKPRLEALTQYALNNGIPVIGTLDAHVAGDIEWERFGAHAEVGTYGQTKIPETLIENSITLENKPYSQSIIEDLAAQLSSEEGVDAVYLEKQKLDGFTNPNTGRLLETLKPDEVIVYGVATEYCVELAVMGMIERGYTVTIVEDAVKELTSDQNSLQKMVDLGAKLIKTEEVWNEEGGIFKD